MKQNFMRAAIMRWERGGYVIELTDDSCYSFGSADNTRTYTHEHLLASEDGPSSKHGLACIREGETLGSAVLGASGGATGVHERSCVLLDDRCIVAVGDRVAALGFPDLALLWEARADSATCFGLHLTADEGHVVVHGELEISKLTVDGHKEWEFAGRDIFTGECVIAGNAIFVTDFNGEQYCIDLQRGCGSIVGAS
jgi:outer membrane protein assembly factor BamB